MSHKFHKSGSNVSGLPSRMDEKVWNKIKKFAHDVWSIDDQGGSPVINRMRAETVKPGSGEPPTSPGHSIEMSHDNTISAGDLVLLFMGGKRVAARVMGLNGDMARIATSEGYEDVPRGWLRKSQTPPPAPKRTITREDIPVQPDPNAGPAQEVDPRLAQTVQNINDMLKANGGSVMISMPSAPNGQTRMLEVTANGQGVAAKFIVLSPEVIHSGNYASVDQLVQDMNLTDGKLQFLAPGRGKSAVKGK